MRACSNCQQEWSVDHYNDRSAECFRCRCRSVNLGFVGGKQYFHDATDKERQDKTVREAASNGIEAVPVGKGTFTGPAPTSSLKGV